MRHDIDDACAPPSVRQDRVRADDHVRTGAMTCALAWRECVLWVAQMALKPHMHLQQRPPQRACEPLYGRARPPLARAPRYQRRSKISTRLRLKVEEQP
eukprot:5678015-Pleurochrysis_carterae.AAC.1